MIDTAAGPRTVGLPKTATSATFLSDVQIGGGCGRRRGNPDGPAATPQMKTPTAVGHDAVRAGALERLSTLTTTSTRGASANGSIAIVGPRPCFRYAIGDGAWRSSHAAAGALTREAPQQQHSKVENET